MGALLPYVHDDFLGDLAGLHTDGVGDVTLYGQYKCDQLIDPKLFSLTGQVSVILPTSDGNRTLDPDRFGVRPTALAYKDFGSVGPGRLGAYGELGVTLSDDADARYGIAASYELSHFVGVLELTGIAGSNYYGSYAQIAPGVVYRGPNGFEFALGIPVGIGSDAPDWGVTAKITYGFQN